MRVSPVRVVIRATARGKHPARGTKLIELLEDCGRANDVSKPLAILHLRDTCEIGGPGKTILETYRAIDRGRFQLHLGVFLRRGESGDSPFTIEARRLGLPVHFVKGFNQYDPCMIWRVVDLVQKHQIDVIHSHEVKSDMITYLAARVYPITIVTTMHGWIRSGLKSRVLIWLDKRIARGFDRVIAVSGLIKEELIESGVPSDRLRLLHNAIVVERYRRIGRRGALAEVIGRHVSRPVIASLGRLSPEKGHSDLIDAVDIVIRRGQKVSLVLIGDGPERSKLTEQINRLGLQGVVHLTGYVQEPQRLLEEIDLMVLPSHTEGLPNAALEALLMEVPVLATAVGGTPEVITDKETGRLVPPHSAESLAGGILEFIADPESWKRMASRGRAVVQANFDFLARTRKLQAIYDEMMMGRS